MRNPAAFTGILDKSLPPAHPDRFLLTGAACFERDRLRVFSRAELHNRQALCDLLALPAGGRQGIDDNELFYLAYMKWGERFVEQLLGEFVIGVYDSLSGRLLLATDHIGFRPLFYADLPQRLIFSDHILAVLAHKPSRRFNNHTVGAYFSRSGDFGQTVEADTRRLCGGTVLMLDEQGLRPRTYWRAEASGKYHFRTDAEWYECLYELVGEAIDCRLPETGRVGIMLSGGLDSSTIACLLSERLRRRNQPLYAFSSVLPVQASAGLADEREYIALLGRHCPNIIQTYADSRGASPFDGLDAFMESEGELPNAFWYMDEIIAKQAAAGGVHTLFTGFGGDYAISSQGHTVIYQLINQGRLWQAALLALQYARVHDQSLARVMRQRYLAFTGIYRRLRAYRQGRAARAAPIMRQHVPAASASDEFAGNQRKRLLQQYNSGAISQALAGFHHRYGAHGLAFAAPFFDKRVSELLFDIPPEFHLKGGVGRSLIRQTFGHVLPAEIARRADKQPYEPGCRERLQENLGSLQGLLNDPACHWIFADYVDADGWRRLLSALDPVAAADNEQVLHALMTGVFINALQALKARGFDFQGGA